MIMKVIIVGAGFSGLATATFLHAKGIPKENILILEKGTVPGGFINTVNKDGYIIETGPEGIRGNAMAANELIDLAGARDIVEPSSNISAKRYLVQKNRLVKLPHGPLGAVTTPLISFRSKLRLIAEPFIKSKDIPAESSLGELIERRFGKGVDHLLDAFISGVYAGDHRKLSASFVFPKLAEFEREHGSIIRGGMRYAKEKKKIDKKGDDKKKKPPFLLNFKNGMISLVERMSDGFDIRCNTPVLSIKKRESKYVVECENDQFSADVVVISTSPNNCPDLELKGKLPLNPIPGPPVAVVALGFDENDLLDRPRGYGYLSPSKEDRFALGTLFTSDVFPHHAPDGKVLFRVILGGRRSPERAKLSTEALVENTLEDIRPLLKLGDAQPEFTHVVRHKSGIPQLELGHWRVDDFRVHLETQNPGIYFNAIGWTGIATAHLANEGRRLAERIINQQLNPL